MRGFIARLQQSGLLESGPEAGLGRKLVAALQSAPLSLGVTALAGSAVAIAILRLSDHGLVTVLAISLCLVGAVRPLLAWLRTHRDGASWGPRMSFAMDAVGWAHAGLMGLLALATLMLCRDTTAHLLAVCLCTGYASSIAGRNAGRAQMAIGQTFLLLGPPAAGLWIAGGLSHRLLSAVLMLMAAAMAEMSVVTHRIIVQALNGQRDKASLAEKYERLARFDSLTGVENRMAMQMHLRAIFEHNRKLQDAVAILWMDLDRFKEINDSLGHMVGDQLLSAVAERLHEAVAGRGIVTRFGGDEFILICPATSRDQARVIAEDVLSYFRHGFEIIGQTLIVTGSIGIAVAPQDGRDADELMQHADMALYDAKRDGRNRAASFTWSMKERFSRVHDIETGLRRAVDNGEMSLCFQPIVDIFDGQVVACEALLRWEHPILGQVPPTEFIPAAENIGVIEELSEWVVKQACMAATHWPSNVRIAVNISPATLKSAELPNSIIATLMETGISARRLELEVTESVLLDDSLQTSQVLRELQLVGLKLVLDDFGTGYSSLSYLRRHRFDTIKVDQSFLAGISSSPEDQAIIRAVGHIARTLEMETVAEGIETVDQLRHARAAGFTAAQGFLLAPPCPQSRLLELMGEDWRLDLPAAETQRGRLRRA